MTVTDAFPMETSGQVIRRAAVAGQPFTVAGERGVILGQQEGTFEAWVLPVKVLSHFTIEADVEGYTVPLDLNSMAREIEVNPGYTVITYSQIAMTLRQIMFAPDESEDGTGAVVMFQVVSFRPVDLTFRFTPEVRPMWPQPSLGTASPEWVPRGASGFYVLHTDYPSMSAAVALPGAQPGILAPFSEKPQVYPVELKLHFDPRRDRTKFFPLLLAVGETEPNSTTAALEGKLERLNAKLPTLYADHAARYKAIEDSLTKVHTPDSSLDYAFTWATISMEQLKAKAYPSGETGLVAGYFSSGDSARPGFGWFFGRDSLYTLYALDSDGDFKLGRQELEFLIKRQRDDGKIMHEYSQTAEVVDWKAFPYMYAAADSTPLFLTAILDYVRSSGDLAFLKEHREAIERAWQFETTHDADGDGIYDNAQGTGWVEGWVAGMPKQEIYLALLDQQASAAMSSICKLLGDEAGSSKASDRAIAIERTIEKEYYEPDQSSYAFSWNGTAGLDRTSTMYPMLAWWNGGSGLPNSEASFRRWASHDFSTDWGTRDVAESDPAYDAISYHQGSVWPLFTGWASMAEYRSGHALAGYAHLMQNADLTTEQDLGAVTELLSGAYFVPFGRSTSHQLWSSAMVVTPALRGLFGVEVNGLKHEVSLNPHLPADWDNAEIDQLHVGDSECSLHFKREGRTLVVRLKSIAGPTVSLTSSVAKARVADQGLTLVFELPAVEVGVKHGLPLAGAQTSQLKVLSEVVEEHEIELELEASAGAVEHLVLKRNDLKVHVLAEGASVISAGGNHESDALEVTFPNGTGYQQRKVVLRW